MTNGNDPAGSITAELLDRCGEVNFSPFGLTKREKFAAMAMQGFLSNPKISEDPKSGEKLRQGLASASILCADALIEALNK